MPSKYKVKADDTIQYVDADGKQHDVQLRSALGYDKEHPAFKAAKRYVINAKKGQASAGSVGKKAQDQKPPTRTTSEPKQSKKTNAKPKYNIFSKKGGVTTEDPAKTVPRQSPTGFKGPRTADAAIGHPPSKSAKTERKIATILSNLAQYAKEAKAKGEKPKDMDLCQISVPGTNLFCGGNLGIPRQQMPQLKGHPKSGSIAERLVKKGKIEGKVGDDGTVIEADCESLYKMALKKAGAKVYKATVNADSLKATQSQLVGSKVSMMIDAMKNDPTGNVASKINQPIFVSKDGYILDGHHRWAALVGMQIASGTGEDIKMNVHVVNMKAKDLVQFTNKFCDRVGISQNSGDVNKK